MGPSEAMGHQGHMGETAWRGGPGRSPGTTGQMSSSAPSSENTRLPAHVLFPPSHPEGRQAVHVTLGTLLQGGGRWRGLCER